MSGVARQQCTTTDSGVWSSGKYVDAVVVEGTDIVSVARWVVVWCVVAGRQFSISGYQWMVIVWYRSGFARQQVSVTRAPIVIEAYRLLGILW